MRRNGWLVLFLAAIWIGATGCSNTQNSQTAESAPPPTMDGNLAPVTTQQPAPVAPNPGSYPAADYSAADYPEIADTAAPVYAPDPPPPLPEYSQPPCPGNDYIWTPGYWNYGNAGYYWVPGVWVVAPYTGALWTPPWWGFNGGRYQWHPGYWGTHIGFYGGVNYGYGYTGHGYYGGYWNRNTFAYNRSVSNVNVNVVHSVYEQRINVPQNNRVSYNGGPRGINARPLLAEVAAMHETHTRPVAAQMQHVRAAESNREQFASVNHGRPAQIAQAQPLAAPNRVPAPRPAPGEQVRTAAPHIPARPEAPLGRPEPNRSNEALPAVPERPAPQPRARAMQERRQQQPQVERGQPERPTPHVRPEPAAHPAPQTHAEPTPPPTQLRPERPQAAPRPEARPQPQERPESAARRAPASRPAPEPRPGPEPRPAPGMRSVPQHPAPKREPQNKPEEKENR